MRFPGPTHLVVLARYPGTRLTGWIESKLEGWLGLEINREKTRVVNLKEEGASLDFLGFVRRQLFLLLDDNYFSHGPRVDSSLLLPSAARCLMKNVTRPNERGGGQIEEAIERDNETGTD